LEYDTGQAGGFAPLRFVPPGRLVVLGLIVDEQRRKLELVTTAARQVWG